MLSLVHFGKRHLALQRHLDDQVQMLASHLQERPEQRRPGEVLVNLARQEQRVRPVGEGIGTALAQVHQELGEELLVFLRLTADEWAAATSLPEVLQGEVVVADTVVLDDLDDRGEPVPSSAAYSVVLVRLTQQGQY